MENREAVELDLLPEPHFYQVDLIFLTLVRDTAFRFQWGNHLHPAPLLPTRLHLPRLGTDSPLRVASSLAGREGANETGHGLPRQLSTHHPPWAGGRLHGWAGEGHGLVWSPLASPSCLPIRMR